MTVMDINEMEIIQLNHLLEFNPTCEMVNGLRVTCGAPAGWVAKTSHPCCEYRVSALACDLCRNAIIRSYDVPIVCTRCQTNTTFREIFKKWTKL